MLLKTISIYNNNLINKKNMENQLYGNLAPYSCIDIYSSWMYSPFYGNIITYQYLQQPNAYVNQQIVTFPQTNMFMPTVVSETLLQVQGSVINRNVTDISSVKKEKVINKQGRNSEEEEFTIKRPKSQTTVTYKKKNTEFNIVNQTFSYLSCQKSKQIVLRILKKDVQKAAEFNHLMLQIKKNNKKYINRKYLKELIQFPGDSKLYKLFLKSDLKSLTIIELRKLLRSLTFYFFREQIYIPLLTSSKIFRETLPQHFWRKRKIIEYLFNKNDINSKEVFPN